MVVKNGVVEKIKRIPATKIVFDLIKNSIHGMKIDEMMKITGYNQRKIYGITFRLKNQGKIKSEERGVYKAT